MDNVDNLDNLEKKPHSDKNASAFSLWWRRRNRSLVLSYLEMRRLIGVLGIALPLVCLFGGRIPEGSDPVLYDTISMYYYASVRDAFVAIVATLGLFLVSYRGHDRRDQFLTTLTGIAALSVVLFPCLYPGSDARHGLFLLPPGKSNIVHLASAGTFFFLLAINSLFLFTESDQPVRRGSAKARQNVVYRVTGLTILASLAAIGLLVILVPETALRESRALFWLESLMLLSFGVSWLVKGGTLRPKGRSNRDAEAASAK